MTCPDRPICPILAALGGCVTSCATCGDREWLDLHRGAAGASEARDGRDLDAAVDQWAVNGRLTGGYDALCTLRSDLIPIPSLCIACVLTYVSGVRQAGLECDADFTRRA